MGNGEIRDYGDKQTKNAEKNVLEGPHGCQVTSRHVMSRHLTSPQVMILHLTSRHINQLINQSLRRPFVHHRCFTSLLCENTTDLVFQYISFFSILKSQGARVLFIR